MTDQTRKYFENWYGENSKRFYSAMMTEEEIAYYKFIVESPAKINLGLNVVRKRTDEYHDLETIFIPLLLSDKITFTKSDVLKLNTCSNVLNEIKENLVLQAVRLLEKKTHKIIALNIFVEKKIPIGGGLGGGSSNAAISLRTINKMFDLGLDYKVLTDLALQLGSDVPYFLNPVPSFAESRGVILHPLKIEIPYPILIVNPRIKIDTAWAFKKIKPVTPVKNLRQIFQESLDDFDKLKSYVKNDFEEVVSNEFPLLKEIKEELYKQGAEFSLMSGTGSTVYGIFSNLQKAYWAEEYFKQQYFTFLNNPFAAVAAIAAFFRNDLRSMSVSSVGNQITCSPSKPLAAFSSWRIRSCGCGPEEEPVIPHAPGESVVHG